MRDGVNALGAQADARSPFAHLTMEPAREGPGGALKFLVRLGGGRAATRWFWVNAIAHGPPVNWQ